MRIAYVAHVNYSRGSGVVKKILSQASLWQELGAKVSVFWFTRNSELRAGAAPGEQVFLYKGGPFSKNRLLALDRLVNEVFQWQADLVYLRRDMVYPAYMQLAGRLPVVVEVNSNELAELWLYSKLQSTYHFLTRSFLDRKVKGFVFPTYELLRTPYYARLRAQKEVIGNGIDLSRLPHLEPTKNEKPVLAFIGHPAPWHGIDKILKMAKAFPDWSFHLIGVGEVASALPNVTTHKFLSASEYLPILAQADVGIGTLALHRKKMSEASPLKVREYLGLGLPVIIGYEDTDFPGGAPFILQLPNTEDNVESSLLQIREFVEKWRGKRVPRDEVAHIDQRVKEIKRLEFFEGVLMQRGKGK